jgi:hypothetical protein
MRMNDLSNMRFFSLLAEPSQEVTNKEIQSAYEDFVEQVKTVGSSNDYSNAFRTINLTRIEVAHLQAVYQYEQGEKCPEICLPGKSLILS